MLPAALMAKDDQAFCDGKYALAQEMLDAAYGPFGTLYPGGERYGPGHLGGLIDLYRLLEGLPDLNFRQPFYYDSREAEKEGEFPAYYFTWFDELPPEGRKEALEFAVQVATRRSDVPLSRQTRSIVRTYLNRMTLAGPPGWWLDPAIVKQRRIDEFYGDAFPNIADVAGKEPFLDWVQYTLSISQQPSAIVWRYRVPYFGERGTLPKNLLEDIERKAELYQSPAWDVLRNIAGSSSSNYSSSATAKLPEKIRDCAASDAEYAKTMIQTYEEMRRSWLPYDTWAKRRPDLLGPFPVLAALPDAMKKHAIMNMTLLTIVSARDPGQAKVVSQVLMELASYTDDPELLSWVNVARGYVATSYPELLDLYRQTPIDARSFRMLNLFSVAELQELAGAVSARPEEKILILRAVAARQFALDDSDGAERTLYELARLDQDSAPKRRYHAPQEVRVALRLLDMGKPSVWLRSAGTPFARDFGLQLRMDSRESIDLGLEFQTGAFLNRDYEYYMLQKPSYGGGVPAMWRALRRHDFPSVPDLETFFPTGPQDRYSQRFPVLTLLAWDEVHQLGVCHGLSQRLAEVIIHWADESSDGWFDNWTDQDEMMAEALRKIVVMGRYASGALVDGKPAGQQAFALLQSRFPDTQAAKATPYWYFQDQGCRK
ncbi:hypothetical protein [Neogemmobacter tilapiae]|uniref:Uncharacterized protein n=1 Tax=Neogemmobacter tilapiae TaxID=875041 RepID=A0A918TIR7_9RHOB|nr:hypothetical protein [Gemmobacter tilapiae]GHC48883.1 hypothetical protein GCM10007315_08700 [Gemmobacter tilapiae]